MYNKITSAAAVVVLLFAANLLSAQGKVDVTSSLHPPHNVVLFTGNTFTLPLFELPAKAELNTATETGSLQASVKHHALHGSWKSYYHAGQLMDEGTLVKGAPDGLWQSWYPNGQLKSVRNYSADLLVRIQQDVEMNHPKISRFAITQRYKKEGKNVLSVLRTSYSYNRTNPSLPSHPLDLVRQNAADPLAYHPPFSQALHHGLYMNYFENGVVKDSGYYKEGLREGLWVQRTVADGGTWKGMYKQGIRQKEWKYYNASGKLKLMIFFNNKGEEEWRKTM
jgi:antitoxin component YwqK of YwqJK toxin-antitoxin module